MAKFINMVHDDMPDRIVLVEQRAFSNVWSNKGWSLYVPPSLDEPEPKKVGTTKPAKKKLTSDLPEEETA